MQTPSTPATTTPSSPQSLLESPTKCPYCAEEVTPNIKFQRRPEIVVAAAALCMTCMWCCALSLCLNPEFADAKQ